MKFLGVVSYLFPCFAAPQRSATSPCDPHTRPSSLRASSSTDTLSRARNIERRRPRALSCGAPGDPHPAPVPRSVAREPSVFASSAPNSLRSSLERNHSRRDSAVSSLIFAMDEVLTGSLLAAERSALQPGQQHAPERKEPKKPTGRVPRYRRPNDGSKWREERHGRPGRPKGIKQAHFLAIGESETSRSRSRGRTETDLN